MHLTFSDSKIHLQVKGHAPYLDVTFGVSNMKRAMDLYQVVTITHGILGKGETSKYQGSIF